MEAITRADLDERLYQTSQPLDPADEAMDAAFAEFYRREAEAMAGRPATERLAWLVHNGELAEQCPRCKTRYVETSSFEYPDMIGAVMGDTYECCGYTESFSTGLEYDAVGRVVDVR